ncbi:conserved hypothetical protein [Talaromyces stipitatus ATCC 10500]|uniref:Zn(2)-C6 fungal-type domain-containing protein n=1 Tax=Talaromyces stipitatus (strain ATCC 10500 / CBS 375.48 / QM 6759 / NRRL 1006) TaxID=441959 RepID=B8M5Z4_TALSN|nr:uncharacterized protein TSTA_033640 [Talaromyces stipitatus ATCC 10500]EED20121.1 conserved hypothetical protein [Talaromyces stipitatus ATCC 10500]
MARRRVAPENRVRAAQACENCKKRKQKCNGTFPCANCSKRQVQCFFAGSVPATGSFPAVSSTAIEQRSNGQKRKFSDLVANMDATNRSEEPTRTADDQPYQGSAFPANVNDAAYHTTDRTVSVSHHEQQHRNRDSLLVRNIPTTSSDQVEQAAHDEISDETDEAELQGMSRMLDDGKGRMLYIGDSAPLSYLQTIRQLVGSVIGTSMFTVDPRRHNILEASMQAQSTGFQYAFTLPDREAALYLVDSFFISTKGMVHLFNEQVFKQRVERTFQNPLAADQSWMCILYLVFAVGLQLRCVTPRPSPKEAAILKRLLSPDVDRSEMFFLCARHLKDSASGIEDGDFASIQALLLMTLYMLSVGKRNTAWAYIGMAVRLAYALGLHRAETQRAYDERERQSMSLPRVLLWRSLYVMDRFLASCLGRPTAIQDEEISEELVPHRERFRDLSPGSVENFEFEALFASVQAAQINGSILHQIYRSRKVSLKIARQIAVQIHEWTQSLPEILQWRPTPMPHDDTGKAMGQLHIWMTYFSTIILLTRPFLLLHVKKVIAQERRRPNPPHAHKSPDSSEAVASSPGEIRVAENPELKKYSAACVRSATHMIRAVQTIRVKGCLPRRNPFIINWMFIAALIVLTNSFFNVYENPENDSIAQMAIYLHQHFAEFDLLAARYLHILKSFQKTIADRRSMNGLLQTNGRNYTLKDPIEDLFSGKGLPSQRRGHSNNETTMLSTDQASNLAPPTQPPVSWEWPATTTSLPRVTSTSTTGGIDLNSVPNGISGDGSNGFGDNVEGLVFPGAEELLGPDPGPVLEEVIHFDMLWPLNQDTGLYSGNIPMYGMDSYL